MLDNIKTTKTPNEHNHHDHYHYTWQNLNLQTRSLLHQQILTIQIFMIIITAYGVMLENLYLQTESLLPPQTVTSSLQRSFLSSPSISFPPYYISWIFSFLLKITFWCSIFQRDIPLPFSTIIFAWQQGMCHLFTAAFKRKENRAVNDHHRRLGASEGHLLATTHHHLNS